MAHTYKIFDKTYNLKNCDIRLHFKYIADYLGNFEFNLNCISIGEIESGYEDDDQLTFYPNVLKLAFTDVNRYNYEYLRQVLESYPDTTNWETTMFELHYNKKGNVSKRMFLGSVDKKTLKYSEKERTLEFDVVDIMQDLKNITCDYIDTGNNNWASFYNTLPRYIYTAYKQIYPDLEYNITNDIDVFKQPNFSGIYLKHNWSFQKYDNPPGNTWHNLGTNWEDIFIVTPGYHVHDYLFRKDNYANMLKAIALQFGMTIGCEEPNKIYAYKRFVSNSFAESKAIDILPYLINNYTKELWLPNVICVQNTFSYADPNSNTPLQDTLRVGDWRPNSADSSKPKNLEQIYSITTDANSGSRQRSDTFIYITHPSHNPPYIASCSVYDPDINETSYMEWILAFLYQKARQRSRDKYEFELYGIDYSMADYYKIKQDGYSQKILRPMTLKKDLINNTTKLTALEMGGLY